MRSREATIARLAAFLRWTARMIGGSWWRPAFRRARCAAVGIALLVSFGITGLATLAAPASPAVAATSSPASTPSSPANLNPDCNLDSVIENLNEGSFNSIGGFDLVGGGDSCQFHITSFSLTQGTVGPQGTPVTVNMGWSDGLTPTADIATTPDTTVEVDVNWGDGTTTTYDVSNILGSVGANCSTAGLNGPTSGVFVCGTPVNPAPFSHDYAVPGNYTVSATATLFLADYCPPDVGCLPVGQPPYYLMADGGDAVAANVVVGHALPTVSIVQTAGATNTQAPPTPPGETAAVGQNVGLSIETSDLDPTAYYHLYLDWGDGDKVAVIPLNSPNPGSGVMDFTPVDPDLNHAYQHPGTYKVIATIVPCTLVLGTTECDETTPTNFVSTPVTIGPAPVIAHVQAVETTSQTNPTFTYTTALPYGGTLPAGVSVTGSATCTSVNGGTLLSQSLAVGTYTVDRSSCSGLSISDTTDYAIEYAGTVISTAGIVVDVAGNGTYDWIDLSWSATPQNLPNGVTISGSVTCGKTTAGPIVPKSSGEIVSPLGGTYTIDGSSCSGLTASDPAYTIDYVGGTLTLTPLETETDVSVSVPGGGTPVYGQPVTLTATTYPFIDGAQFPFDPAGFDFVAARPTGTVQFYDNGNPVGAPVSVDNENASSAVLVTTLTTSDLAPTESCLTLPGGGGADCIFAFGDLITAKYSGDNDYQASTSAAYNAAAGVQVGIAPTTTSVAASTTSAVYGQPVTLTASVNPAAPSGSGLAPSGPVQFYDNGAPLGDPVSLDTTGTASLTTTSLPITLLCTAPGLFQMCGAGPGDQITAQYLGNDQYFGSTAPTTGAPAVAVGLGQTTTTVTAPSSSSVPNAPVTFTATVSAVAPSQGTPIGSVTFTDGNALLGSASLADGVATLTTSSLAAGAHSITASYSGDSNFGNSTSQALSQTVNQAPTELSLASIPNTSSVWGQGVTFTATVAVPGAGGSTGIATFPTGTVTFSDGSTVLGTGTLSTSNGVTSATFTTAGLAVSGHSITASYGGDGTYEPSTTNQSLSQTVNQAATTLSLGSTPNPSSVWGQGVTFTATVAPVSPGAGTPTGMVTFSDGNSVLGTGTLSTSNGVTSATFTTASLAVGGHPITASYGGDGNFGNSTSQTLSQTVNQAATTLSLGSTPNPSIHGQTVTFTATVAPVSPGAGTPTGAVTFKDGSSVLGTGTLSTTKGVTTATLTTSSFALGTHTIAAAYAGDANFLTRSTTTTQYVDTSLSSYPHLPSGAYNLANANLSGAYLLDLSLAGASLANSNFTGANLNLATLTNANLSSSNFTRASFTGANLRGANLSSANLSGANLTGANLTGDNLGGANLSGANLSGANLGGANLSGANLGGANLSGANLTGANLTRDNLANANLLGAIGLSTATLTNVHWSMTTCPDGTLSNSDGGTCRGHM